MRNVCLIPARSGSKGLKDKNMAFLNNKPVLQHSIEAALESGIFKPTDIYLSTDSKDYIEHLGDLGISMLYRDPELASDNATTADVVVDFLSKFEEDVNLVLLQPTSPLRTGVHIHEAFAMYEQHNGDNIVVSVSEVDKSPSLMTEFGPNNELKDIVGIDQGYRRQNFGTLYAPNGAIYITNKTDYLQSRSFFTEKTLGYTMNKKSSIDIDDYDDFVKAIGAIFFDYSRRERESKLMYETRFQQMLDGSSKIILGDSRTEPLAIEGFKNYSMGGITAKTTYENCVSHLDPSTIEHVVINLGVNDLIVGYDVNEAYENIMELVNYFDKAQISLCNIFPTIYRPNISNDDIRALNAKLSKVNNVSLIEVYDQFEHNHKLDYNLTTDGLHLKQVGNQKLQAIIESNL